MPARLSVLLRDAGIAPGTVPDTDIRGISEDSREIRPGWIFVAVRGTTDSGERYVADAVGRGAVAVVSEEPLRSEVPVVVVPNGRRALADLAVAFNDHPAEKLTCFGVTGTDGKTTTCFLLTSILRATGHSTGLMTTVEIEVGGKPVPQSDRLTTPSAPFVQRTLAAMVAAGDTHAVIECSSHALDQERLRGVTLEAAAITNITSDHIEFHGSQDSYVSAKARIGAMIRDANKPALIVNADSEGAVRAAHVSGRHRLTFGLAAGADIRADRIESDLSGSRFTVHFRGRSRSGWIPLPGEHNVYNALAALGLAACAGIDLDAGVTALARPMLPRGRLQPIDLGQPFTVFVDYAHTENAFRSVLKFLSAAARDDDRRLLAVFGAAGDRDRAKRPVLAQIAARLCEFFVITNEDPFGEDRDEIARQIAQGAPRAKEGTQWLIEMDRRKAIELALERARPGDVVVITGKGHETSIAQGDDQIPWSDADVVRELLTARTPDCA